MKRCSRCVLPEIVPNIHFSDDGVCSVCEKHNQQSEVNWRAKEQELLKILEEARLRKLPYDAIIPWSGGKDSTFVLYKMVKFYGLKVLAINYHNGFQSDCARNNILNVADRLGIDCVMLKPNWDLMKKLYVAFLRYKGEICTVCNTVGYVLILSFALNQSKFLGGFPLIIGGWSSKLEGMGGADTFNYSGFKTILKKEAGLVEAFEGHPMVDKNVCEFLESINDPRFAAQYTGLSKLKIIQLPDFLDWNHDLINQSLQDETGYTIPASGQTSHFDCNISPVARYLFEKEWGFDQYAITYSEMIRQNRMDRSEALLKLESQSPEEPPQMKDFLNVLGIKRNDISVKKVA